MSDQVMLLADLTARRMRRDKTVRRAPQRMIRRQRLRRRHVQVGPRETPPFKRRQQRLLINSRAAPDVIKDRARLHLPESVFVEIPHGRLIARQQVDYMIGPRQKLLDLLSGNEPDRLVAFDSSPHADQVHPKWREQFAQPDRNRPETEEQRRLSVQ